ncbi:MAG: glucose-6-phosphate isomerase [Acidobacteriota bacterium]
MHSSDSIPAEPAVLALADRLDGRFALWAGPLSDGVKACLERLSHERVLERLFAREPALWSADPAVQATIANRLGWLGSPDSMVESVPRLTAFAAAIRDGGFTHVVLLGMGGSSLAPEVMRAMLGVRPGWPAFHMLDSTDPAAVLAIEQAIDIDHTLFLLASKSGGTIEPNSMAAYFRSRIEVRGVARWADRFVAITDEGTALHRRAVDEHFREIFVNRSDIGGRYSAVSFFGLVPAALMGHDVAAMIDWARAMLWVCGPGRPVGTNSAMLLGAAMSLGAQHGRDKLTLAAPPPLESFGLWVEQLVAESTGKHGHGVVPIAGERLAAASSYGPDRVMVHLGLVGQTSAAIRDQIREMASSGMPIAQIELPEAEALAAEFVRWELATAIAGVLLGVNPFDEPNVQQAKDATQRLLAHYAENRHLAPPPSTRLIAGQYAWLSACAQAVVGDGGAGRFLSVVEPGDYLAILAFVGPDPALAAALARLRESARELTRAATTLGYGPRYLHSTGQLHKGGAGNGVFLVLTTDPVTDVAIPGQGFSFGTLELAQALGDVASLDAAGRRVLHIHLPRPEPALVDAICRALTDGLVRADLHKVIST